ncbi:uncharacterized protein LOC114469951 [Gouania willdenowi]|uniref:uncharacterized protein LOC114469951 n=1 Tax=Gouania willdenowi TaxID=441366 RepID=UPI001055EF68|nr:uncharacterized protein LOC114469951 [Gouania willdenowi]
MVFLCVLLLIICPSVTSERFIYKEYGNSVTFTCSSMGCPSSTDEYVAMYVYHEFITRKEVLFSSKYSPDYTVAERPRYKGRIQTSSSFRNRSITISNLTVDDSGVYTCVYKDDAHRLSQCDLYFVVIKGNASCPLTTGKEKTTLLMLVVLACLVGIMITTMILLFVFLKVKQWRKSRKLRRGASQLSNVYEVMTKNGFQHVEVPEQFSESPIDVE